MARATRPSTASSARAALVERDQQRDRRGAVGDQGRDPADQGRAGEGDPVGGTQRRAAGPAERGRQGAVDDQGEGEPGRPARSCQTDGGREPGEQQQLPGEPGREVALNRSHRSSVHGG